MLLDGSDDAGDDFRVRGRDFVVFGRIDFEVIQPRLFVDDGFVVVAVLGDVVDFPGAQTGGIKFFAAVVTIDFAFDGFTIEQEAG